MLINEMWKSYNSFILLAVPFFLLAANLMNAAGITERLVKLARALVGHLPGGLAHVNVLVSMLFAGISGSSTADAAGIGSLMIPAMKKQGYDSSFSVAITACSSVMGVIIPPSIMMIVWGGLMSVSIGGLFLAGVLPGLAIALLMMATVFVYAKARDYPVYQRASRAELLRASREAILALVTPAIIVGGIVGGLFTPTEASVVAVIYSGVLGGVIYRSIGPKEFPNVFYESARFASISLFCIGTASAFGWLLAYYRIPQALVDVMAAVGRWTRGDRIPDRIGFFAGWHVHRRDSRDHRSRHRPAAAGGKRRDASDSFRHDRSHCVGIRLGDATLRIVLADLVRAWRNQNRGRLERCWNRLGADVGIVSRGDLVSRLCAVSTAFADTGFSVSRAVVAQFGLL